MELSIEDFNFLKDRLKTFDYPCINQKSDVEISKLFDKENRIFLMTWMLTKYMPEYTKRLDIAKDKKRIECTLANILLENGFCKSTEKDIFVTEGINTDTTNQMKMFKRFFHILSVTISYQSDKENFSNDEMQYKECFLKLTKDILDKKILRDIDLFSSYGTFNKLTKQEQKDLLQDYKTKIENNITMDNTPPQKISENVFVTETKIITDMKKFQMATNQFIETCTDTIINNHETENIALNLDDLEKCIKEDALYVNKTLEILEKKVSLKKILQEEDTSDQTDSIDKYSATILKHYVTSEEILDEIRENSI